jgi:hypothetical protein
MGEISVLFAVEAEQLLLTDMFEEAIDLCYEGLKLYPEYASAYSIISRALCKLNKKDDALETINNAIYLFPSNKLLKSVKDEIECYQHIVNDDPFADNFAPIVTDDDPFAAKVESNNKHISEQFTHINESYSANSDNSDFADSLTNNEHSFDIDSMFSNAPAYDSENDISGEPDENSSESENIELNVVDDLFANNEPDILNSEPDENSSESENIELNVVDDLFANNEPDILNSEPDENSSESENIEFNVVDNLFANNSNNTNADDIKSTTINYENDGVIEYTVINDFEIEENIQNTDQIKNNIYNAESENLAVGQYENTDYADNNTYLENIDSEIDELNSLDDEKNEEQSYNFAQDSKLVNEYLSEEIPLIEGHVSNEELLSNLTAKLNVVNADLEINTLETAVEEVKYEKYNFAESTYKDELGDISDVLLDVDTTKQTENNIEVIEIEEELATHLKKYVGVTGFVSKFTNAPDFFDKRIKSRKLDLIPGLDNSPIRDSRQMSKRIFHYQCLPQEPDLCIQHDTIKEHFEDFSSLFGFKSSINEEIIKPEITESNKPKHELITETIANIYVLQGAYTEAIKAYTELSLIYPEKSEYFENKIKDTQSKEESIIKD